RGHPPADIEALEDLLLRISRLVEEVPELVELDLNPVMALPPGRGCLIVDARIALKAGENGLSAEAGSPKCPGKLSYVACRSWGSILVEKEMIAKPNVIESLILRSADNCAARHVIPVK